MSITVLSFEFSLQEKHQSPRERPEKGNNAVKCLEHES